MSGRESYLRRTRRDVNKTRRSDIVPAQRTGKPNHASRAVDIDKIFGVVRDEHGRVSQIGGSHVRAPLSAPAAPVQMDAGGDDPGDSDDHVLAVPSSVE